MDRQSRVPAAMSLPSSPPSSQPSSLPFSKTRSAAGLLFVSGELPLADDGSIPEGIEAQTSLTLARIANTLRDNGLALADVVSVTAYLVDPADFAAFNRVYAAAFAEPRPVRATVRADLMLPNARLELSVIAAQPQR
jgi:2-iminobutanoate/2-iminopropanoate deaminase